MMPDGGTNPETEECIHLIFPASACTICHPKPKATTGDGVSGRTMVAIYDGQCPDCNLPIVADQSWIKQLKGIWYHKSCADNLDRNR